MGHISVERKAYQRLRSTQRSRYLADGLDNKKNISFAGSKQKGGKHVGTSISEVINRRGGLAAVRRRLGVGAAACRSHPKSHPRHRRHAAQSATCGLADVAAHI